MTQTHSHILRLYRLEVLYSAATLLLIILLFSSKLYATPSTLKTAANIDAKSLSHANKLANIYNKVRLAFINYDIPDIRANTFVPKSTPAPPRQKAIAFGKTLPDIYKYHLVKVATNGKLTGLWFILKKPAGKSQMAILFRFKQDDTGKWRTHPRTYHINDSDDSKKSALTLMNELKL